jgi:signal transduction histidine kinase
MKNGMQAMGKGGILRIETHAFKDRVSVVISDSGSGIPPDQMEKIFNYYWIWLGLSFTILVISVWLTLHPF